MHPHIHAKNNPDKPAFIMANSGEVVTCKELDERSNKIANLFRSKNLNSGDHIAIFMENNVRFTEILWAAQRSGLYYTPISSRLTASEVEYIIRDCEAKLIITSNALKHVVVELTNLINDIPDRYIIDGEIDGWNSLEESLISMPSSPINDEIMGQDMLYSSGTTGKPKGIKLPLKNIPIEQSEDLMQVVTGLYGTNQDTVYLSPAPLYHAAPLRFTMGVNYLGGTNIIMENFDAESSLKFIEKYSVSMSQWVPTMFVKMFKLPDDIRNKYDLSSHKCAIHAAAPCPIKIKKMMIEWWGPIIHEFYAGSEGNGFIACNSEEWLAHEGTVGKPIVGIPHICNDEGEELPIGEEGTIWFEGDSDFKYHKDEEKTKESRHTIHGNWSTLGDVGKLDEDGYLYLTDRKAFMIITGGVNVYPQETENLLITHPKVSDCAVIGVPNEEFGEEVKAVIEPIEWSERGENLEEELINFCKENLSSIKCPKSIDFEKELPRHPTGKLYKRLLKDRYWGNKSSKIV
ncbi:MAG: AMP-binding protein [Pseudomonadota bacterium]|nr:AMP-binding protein [Pseudomonadota bacterium]